MTYYEERLTSDKDALRAKVELLSQLTVTALGNAERAFQTGDYELAYATILEDGPINRLTEELESDSHRFIARHLPTGGHLRFVSAVMRIAILLERVGDYAVGISRNAVALRHDIASDFKHKTSAMAEHAITMFRQSIQAFVQQDVELARDTMATAASIDQEYESALATLSSQTEHARPLTDLFACLMVILQLERVSDQAKNLCEEAVFALTGETKRRKPARVLVLDHRDDGPTQLAAAIANRSYADKIEVTNCGVHPAEAVHSDVTEFLRGHGHPTESLVTTTLAELKDPIDSFKVIVSLAGSVESIRSH